MSDAASLLPPNTTPQERALEQAVARVGAVPVQIDTLWNPATCPKAFLPWLAWALSVDEWDPEWPEEFQRATVKNAYFLHAHKGSPASLQRVLTDAGYGDSTVVEGIAALTHDGSWLHDGSEYHGTNSAWYRYSVFINRPLTLAQAAKVTKLLKATAPVRCVLDNLNYIEALHVHDGTWLHDGTYTHGVA